MNVKRRGRSHIDLASGGRMTAGLNGVGGGGTNKAEGEKRTHEIRRTEEDNKRLTTEKMLCAFTPVTDRSKGRKSAVIFAFTKSNTSICQPFQKVKTAQIPAFVFIFSRVISGRHEVV